MGIKVPLKEYVDWCHDNRLEHGVILYEGQQQYIEYTNGILTWHRDDEVIRLNPFSVFSIDDDYTHFYEFFGYKQAQVRNEKINDILK